METIISWITTVLKGTILLSAYGYSKVINGLAKNVFTVFLLHEVFLGYVNVESAVAGDLWYMLLHMLLCAVIIYGICWCCGWIYHKVTDPIFSIIDKSEKVPVIEV